MAGYGDPPEGKKFVKNDPRINRLGRPKNMDGLKELTQALVHEEAKTAGDKALVIGGHKVTILEAILRDWMMSKDFRKQQAALEFAFGKVPAQMEHSGPNNGPIETKITHDLSKLTLDELIELRSIINKVAN